MLYMHILIMAGIFLYTLHRYSLVTSSPVAVPFYYDRQLLMSCVDLGYATLYQHTLPYLPPETYINTTLNVKR